MSRVLSLRILLKRLDAKKRREGWLTFNGWKRRGRAVIKKSKAREWNAYGTALFNEAQTVEMDDHTDERPDDWGGPDGPWGDQ